MSVANNDPKFLNTPEAEYIRRVFSAVAKATAVLAHPDKKDRSWTQNGFPPSWKWPYNFVRKDATAYAVTTMKHALALLEPPPQPKPSREKTLLWIYIMVLIVPSFLFVAVVLASTLIWYR